MRVRWATVADFDLLRGGPKTSSRSLVLLVNEEPVAMASMRYQGQLAVPVASLDFLGGKIPPALALHKFARAAIAEARKAGIKRFLAIADCSIPRSEAWLARLGLVLVGRKEQGGIYEWEQAQ